MEIDRKRQSDIEKKKTEMKDITGAYRFVFNTKEGKKVLEDICGKSYYNTSMMNQDMPTNDIFFREGRRSMFLYIKSMIEREID